jgi:hypothetical protein
LACLFTLQVQYVSADDIPAEVFAREKEIEMGREDLKNKPDAIRCVVHHGSQWWCMSTGTAWLYQKSSSRGQLCRESMSSGLPQRAPPSPTSDRILFLCQYSQNLDKPYDLITGSAVSHSCSVNVFVITCRAKIAEGRVQKLAQDMALLPQPYLMDPSKTVEQVGC